MIAVLRRISFSKYLTHYDTFILRAAKMSWALRGAGCTCTAPHKQNTIRITACTGNCKYMLYSCNEYIYKIVNIFVYIILDIFAFVKYNRYRFVSIFVTILYQKRSNFYGKHFCRGLYIQK